MRMRFTWLPMLSAMVVAASPGLPEVQAGSLTYSHSSSALPGAAGPPITLLSITGDNDGTNYKFTLTFANPTIEGPSSGNDDSVYGFINMDTDDNAATGVTGSVLDTNGFQPGFGRFSPSTLGIDAYINLSSEGDPLHGAPGLVDLVTTNGFTPIDTVSVAYANRTGSTPSTLTISIPLSVFSNNQITLLDAGDFSAVVGNANNATDFLPSVSAVPEPGAILLLASGLSVSAIAAGRLRRGARGGYPVAKHPGLNGAVRRISRMRVVWRTVGPRADNRRPRERSAPRPGDVRTARPTRRETIRGMRPCVASA